MLRNARNQTIAWGAAGIPLLVAFVQTLLALFGYTSSSAGLTPITEPILSVPVLFEAAVVFKQSSALVMGLFVLIVAAWVGQGVAMLVTEHRQWAYGTATLSAVLFFVLFFGVYAPLASAGIPTAQLAAFYLVPVCAAGLQLFAVHTYPWNEVVLEETSADLGRLESELESIESTFESEYSARFDRLDDLEDVAPSGVRDVREGAADFHDRLEELRSDIESIEAMADGEDARAARANIEAELDEIDPVARVTALDDRLEQALTSGLRTEYGEFVVRSPFNERYETVNLPTAYRELSLPEGPDTVHLDHVDEALLDVVRDADSYDTVAAAIDAVEQHHSEVRSYIREQEAPVVDAIETTESRLETVTDQVETMDVPFQDRVEDVLVNGRDPDVTGAADVRDALDRARDALHECRFDEASSTAETAAAGAETLVSAVEFLSTLEASIEGTHASVSIPSSVPLAAVESLVPAIQAGYDGVSVSLNTGSRTIGFGYESTPSADSESEDDEAGAAASPSASTEEVTRVAGPESVVDGVLYALRDFEARAEGEERIVQYRLEDLPDAVADTDVLVNIERFASRQSDLFSAVDLQGPEPPGLIEFTAVDGTSVDRALQEAHDRFREKYT